MVLARGRKIAGLTSALMAAFVVWLTPSTAPAGDNDLDDDDEADAGPKVKPKPGAAAPAPVVVVRGHAYSLAECLALAERNHPNLWAARARLAFVHAQLDEARWTPFWQWNANSTFGVLPNIGGTAFYTAASSQALNTSFTSSLQPFFRVDVNGVIPIYTFGKIDSIRRAAEAQVRVNEWDLEKHRQQIRMDVRRAFFGLMLARDARYLVADIVDRIDKAIEGINARLERNDPGAEEIDKLRMQVYKDEILARAAEAQRGETFATAALRFLTGVQSAFDIPDEPLKPPTVPVGPVVSYLTAARLFRPEVNMARAGIAARRAQVEFAQARYFPDLGLGASASYSTAPSAIIQNNPWVIDPFNRFGFGVAFGARWNLDLLPQSARVAQAESQLEEVRALERLALGGIAVEVENAYAVAIEAKTRTEAWDRAEHRSKQWISTVQDSIDLGTKDERALIEPLRVYVNARINHIYSLMDFNVALSDLARVSGWDAAAPGG